MNSNKSVRITGLTTIVVTLFLLCSAAHVARAQQGEPAGPTKPVVVVNTPAQPVPVTGTITGNVTVGNTLNVNAQQSGPWSVGITGTPTVRIDPLNNTVVTAARPTVQLLDTGVYSINTGGYPRLGPFNVGQFSKIRVMAQNNSDSDGYFIIYVSTSLSGGQYISLEPAIRLEPGEQMSRSYDVPGQQVYINVGGNGPNRNGVIALFGN